MSNPVIPRPEHPRPDFMRQTFCNLNGQWQFAFDDADAGMAEKWYDPAHKLDRTITVPFCYQCKASGINAPDEIHPILWYRRCFRVPADMAGKRILLRFGAVDYRAAVYINGKLAGGHVGGYTPFAVDITDYLTDGENDLCLRVEDHPDPTQPRGKQNWRPGLSVCWYTPVSGIWQTVYLEAVSDLYIDYIHVTPDIDTGFATAEIMLNRIPDGEIAVRAQASMDGKAVRTVTVSANSRTVRVSMDMSTNDTIHPAVLWDMSNPALYDLRVEVLSGTEVSDTVDTYFGMRKIEQKNGVIYLNNRRIYQRLVLDQGYWADTLLTPPSDEAIREDLLWTQKFGYNGVRKHQKIEDPRYYYWADKMGLLVWGELPSAYDFTDETVHNLCTTMEEFICRDFNHPSIITWVTANESWGVMQLYANARQQALCSALYYLTKAADGTRLCSGNDGWEQVHTDICGLHDYSSEARVLNAHFADRAFVEANTCDARHTYVDGYTPSGKEAFLVTEFGGIAFAGIGAQGTMGGTETWGYHDKVADEAAFLERFRTAVGSILQIPYNQGYCYTQLTDVMQEINGLLTPDRKPKVDAEKVRQINQNPDWHAQRMLH